MIRVVYFDWNGTLLADTQTVVDVVNKVTQKHKKGRLTKRRYQEIFNIPASELYKKMGFSEEEIKSHMKDIQQNFHKHYEPVASRTRLRTGARNVLNWLMNEGIDMVLASNHTRSGIDSQLDRLKLDQFFSFSSTNPDGNTASVKRTKGEKIKKHMLRHRYKPHEAIIVGDTPEEIHIGKEIGMYTVAITEGFSTKKRLKAEKPDKIITNLLQLIEIVKKLNKK